MAVNLDMWQNIVEVHWGGGGELRYIVTNVRMPKGFTSTKTSPSDSSVSGPAYQPPQDVQFTTSYLSSCSAEIEIQTKSTYVGYRREIGEGFEVEWQGDWFDEAEFSGWPVTRYEETIPPWTLWRGRSSVFQYDSIPPLELGGSHGYAVTAPWGPVMTPWFSMFRGNITTIPHNLLQRELTGADTNVEVPYGLPLVGVDSALPEGEEDTSGEKTTFVLNTSVDRYTKSASCSELGTFRTFYYGGRLVLVWWGLIGFYWTKIGAATATEVDHFEHTIDFSGLTCQYQDRTFNAIGIQYVKDNASAFINVLILLEIQPEEPEEP